jgi:pimeloyl-ACP methyl ester carboxylesterase
VRPRRALIALIAVLATCVVPLPAPAIADQRCTETDVPVTLALLLPQKVHGKLCLPAGDIPKTVQLLVHGGTYNRLYWDLPNVPVRYSYQRDMADQGLATFAIDALGSGESSRPLSALITGTALASVVHQVIGQLRAGRVGGTRFDRVVLVGHSMGSGIVAVEASTYHDVDGVILTGFSHSMDLLALTAIFVDGVRPAALDPLLSRRNSDPGYVTTMPGTRRVFHDPGLVDADVLTADEATKDQVAATVVPDLLTLAFNGPLTRSIAAPVLTANGALDGLFCAFHCAGTEELRAAEAGFFTSELSVFLLPGSGHSLGLSRNAPDYRAAVRDWVTARFPG